MNIAFMDSYGTCYLEDRMFDNSQCALGENLLIPTISLKKSLEMDGHIVHTIDMFSDIKDIDVLVLFGIPQSIDNADSVTEWIKTYAKIILLKRTDYYHIALKKLKKEQRVLIVVEPPVVSPKSYDVRYHQYFRSVSTWNTNLIDAYGYVRYFYPQPLPTKKYGLAFSEKKLCTMICGNKQSNYANELYSERRKFISFFENKDDVFDLYGIGWEKEGIKNYKGKTDHKLDTLSQYKYCICYENMCNIRGYITEKIFDCFFAGVVPIYWGADDIIDFIPERCFIDRRDYSSEKEVYDFMLSVSEPKYNSYISAAKDFINSERFMNSFSVEAYVDRMKKIILGES